MVVLSCSSKFHAFALAEQLARHQLLLKFHTLFFSQKNSFYRRFHDRKDHEIIPVALVETFPIFLPIYFLWKDYYKRANFYDKLVAKRLKYSVQDYSVFIGWSSLSYYSALEAKKCGKTVIIERGSSHIAYQNDILIEEYNRFGIDFSIDERIIEKELLEYELADFISIPSKFVLDSFISKGFSKQKLIVNQYGSGNIFRSPNIIRKASSTFRILYLGSATIRKGLIYLFQALKLLQHSISLNSFEFWIIGSINNELKSTISEYSEVNWRFFGHINHYDLPDLIAQCDVAVQPSIEEGLSMVIPQLLSCGVPVIATTNTGGEDVVIHGVNGFIVPIRNPIALKEKLEYCFGNPQALSEMKEHAMRLSLQNCTWEMYGDRYSDFLNTIIK